MQRDIPGSPAPPRTGQTSLILAWIAIGVCLGASAFFGGLIGTPIEAIALAVLILPWPVALGTLAVAIVALLRGRKSRGIAVLIAALLLVPFAYFTQFVSLAVYGSSAKMEEEWQQTRMLENLRTIAKAKGAWVADTEAKNATLVTMANLTSYLAGKEITPVLGESYNPKPVGEAPTATLPKGKYLWHSPTWDGPFVAAYFESMLSQPSFDPMGQAAWQFTHPSGKWLPLFWKTSPRVVPTVSAAPATAPEE